MYVDEWKFKNSVEGKFFSSDGRPTWGTPFDFNKENKKDHYRCKF